MQILGFSFGFLFLSVFAWEWIQIQTQKKSKFIAVTLYNNWYVKVKVGEQMLNMVLDPSSNINYIFEDGSYSGETSISITTSNLVLTSSTLFGDLSGKIANDFFVYDFILDNQEKNSYTVRQNFVWVRKGANVNYIQKDIDGILGLGTSSDNSPFYNKMSIIEHLLSVGLISSRSATFSYIKGQLILGTDDSIIAKNQSIININSSHKVNKNYLPLYYCETIKFGFNQGNSRYFNIDENVLVNATFVGIEDKDVIISASDASKINWFNDKLETVGNRNENDKVNTAIYSNTNDNFFVFNNNKIDSLNTKNNIWNFNSIKLFQSEYLTYDYGNNEMKVINCEYCGQTPNWLRLHLLKYTMYFLLMSWGLVSLCIGFTKYTQYRKEKAMKFRKKYNIM